MTIEDRRQKLQRELDAAKTPEERNRLGQFSTPYDLACDIVHYAKSLLVPGTVSFLEPAIGTGVFYSALLDVFGDHDHTALGFEIDPHYAIPAKKLWDSSRLNLQTGDFLKHHVPKESEKYSLLISNPPYCRHHHIESQWKKELQRQVWDATRLKISGLAGLYAYFLILSTRWLAPGAVSCWLIPSEFMDVNFGEAVKTYLLRHVNLIRIHRFEPQDVQFGDAMITSSVVVFKNEPPSPAPVLFTQGGRLAAPTQQKTVSRNTLADCHKWTQIFGDNITKRDEPTIGDFFHIKRGLATGCNNFFIVDEATIEQYAIPHSYLTPVLPSPRYIASNLIQRTSDGCPELKQRRFLFSCNKTETEIRREHPKMWEYIETGRRSGVPDGYVCSRRTPWYSCEKRTPAPLVIPYMGRGSQVRHLFRFMLNLSDAVPTNVYLMLYPRQQFADKLRDQATLIAVWELLNNIPLIQLTSNGRVYGGGLHKMEPNELASIPVEKLDTLLNAPKQRRSQYIFCLS